MDKNWIDDICSVVGGEKNNPNRVRERISNSYRLIQTNKKKVIKENKKKGGRGVVTGRNPGPTTPSPCSVYSDELLLRMGDPPLPPLRSSLSASALRDVDDSLSQDRRSTATNRSSLRRGWSVLNRPSARRGELLDQTLRRVGKDCTPPNRIRVGFVTREWFFVGCGVDGERDTSLIFLLVFVFSFSQRDGAYRTTTVSRTLCFRVYRRSTVCWYHADILLPCCISSSSSSSLFVCWDVCLYVDVILILLKRVRKR